MMTSCPLCPSVMPIHCWLFHGRLAEFQDGQWPRAVFRLVPQCGSACCGMLLNFGWVTQGIESVLSTKSSQISEATVSCLSTLHSRLSG